VTKCISPAVYEIVGSKLPHQCKLVLKHNWVTTLVLPGHVTSSVTCLFDAPYGTFYFWSIGTEPITPTVFEIFAFSYIWVTTFTFWGHVTSSVMWPMDSPVAISYRCSIVTKCVSPAVYEKVGSKLPHQCKSSMYSLCKIWVHILIYDSTMSIQYDTFIELR